MSIVPRLPSMTIRIVTPMPPSPPPFEPPVVGVTVTVGDGLGVGDGEGVGVGVGALTMNVVSFAREAWLLEKTTTVYVPGVTVAGIVKVAEKCPVVSEEVVSCTRISLCALAATWIVNRWAGNQFSPVTVI